MDKQGGGMKFRIRGLLIFVWVVITVPLWAVVCTVTGLFSRAITQMIGRSWMPLFLKLAGVKITVRGIEKLDKNECCLFFANHSSLLDIPVMYAGVKNPLVFIAKKELFWIPFMGWGMRGMGHVSIDRSSARKALVSFKKAIERVKKERLSLVLFPEGTRSVDGSLGEFKQGSFTIALDAGIKVVPIVLRNTRACLPKKELLVRPGAVSIDICDPIDVTGMDKRTLMLLVREKIEKTLDAKR
jgi:1-acyl-sn-glycerol-3-phosphate acyltransferase